MKKIINLFLLMSVMFGFSQQSQLWKGYFSYNSIKDISQNTTQVYVASENAYFKRNIATNEISTTSTVEGLSGETISQIYHSETFKKTFIGHTNGLLMVVNDNDGAMLNVVGIINKPSIPPDKKKINHFFEHNGKLYIATDFGICVFNLSLSEFGDTLFIGSGGSNVEILQTTVHNDFIYAVAKDYGLLKASVTNPNLIDYAQWSMVSSGSWVSVETTGNQLVAVNLSGTLYKFAGDTPSAVITYPQVPVDTRFYNGYLVITSQNYVYIYDNQLVQITQVNNIPNVADSFTCATVIDDKIYIGTQSSGLFTTALSNPTIFDNVTPNGPNKNRLFAIKTISNGLWACYGDYTISYNPFPLDFYGVSKFTTDNGWKNIPYEDLFGTKSITHILVNPSDENQVYFSSFYSGVLKLENDIPALLYNNNNSTLQISAPATVDNIRVNGAAADSDGNLWFNNSRVDNNLHVLRTNGQWQGYPVSAVVTPRTTDFNRMKVDKNGTKWMTTNRFGVVGFNEKLNKSISITEGFGEGNLPNKEARSLAIDKKNKLWIGTIKGLRILSSVDSFLTQDELETSAIIILEDELAQELLFQKFITDIEVDGANNKWIGTSGEGVFYLSADGQQTFNIFTKENSPLPSNMINDIDINEATGEVFIATDKGLVSYKGTATVGAENLENVIVFPNPVRPGFNGNVAVTGLMDKANVKITDIEGNLVHEAIAEGGTVLWNTKAFGKHNVASGVYMVLISSDDGLETKVKKVMIIR
ncbi:two-component regulator propeller domain-containing protein [Flavobacterium sp.]|uniref:type IX secretion system anionic LPS delivery protein PorZ n=1 Tax=Flavobacterium sp. TaxID=239 RepID=UPI00261F1653|nr:two-component regulator propeller domain-containing protein [Flavobacterium sp.]